MWETRARLSCITLQLPPHTNAIARALPHRARPRYPPASVQVAGERLLDHARLSCDTSQHKKELSLGADSVDLWAHTFGTVVPTGLARTEVGDKAGQAVPGCSTLHPMQRLGLWMDYATTHWHK